MRIRRGKLAALAAIIGATSLVLAACSPGTDPAPSGTEAPGVNEPDPIKIAVPLELTGPTAVFGIDQLNALEIVVERVNAQGGIKSMGGAKLELMIEDSQSDPEVAVQLLREMKAEGAVFALGPSGSGAVVASKPVLESLNLPWIGLSVDDRVTEDNEDRVMWRPVNNMTKFTQDAANFLEEQITSGKVSLDKVAVVTMTIAPGPQVRDVLQTRLNALGIQTQVFEYDPAETRDFSNLVAQLRDGNFDMIAGISYPNDGTLFAEAMTLQDWRPSQGFMYVLGAHYTNSFRNTFGTATENWLVTSYAASDSSCAAAQELNDAYMAKHGVPLVGLAGGIPSVVAVMVAALEKAGSTDPEALKAALGSLELDNCEGFYTLAGSLRFDEKGDNAEFVATVVQHQGELDQPAVWPSNVAVRDATWPAR